MKKIISTIVLLGVIVLLLLAIIYHISPYIFHKKRLIIYIAGSLTMPFQEAEKLYENENPNVDVVLVISGSRDLARRISELGEYADIFASADYSLIEDMLYPEYAEWYLVFARNELVLAYTNESKYADEINSTNWFEILNRSDVKWGHSDPNLDPCGYRTLIVLKLAEIYYNVTGIYESLKKNEVIRPKSVDLIALLESGELDYAFEYRSVAVQHNLSFVELPPQINLGYAEYNDFYSKANVTLSDGTVMVGEAILYALTILKNSTNKDLAIDFVKFLFENREKLFNENGQPAVYPALAFNYEALPEELKEDAKEWKK